MLISSSKHVMISYRTRHVSNPVKLKCCSVSCSSWQISLGAYNGCGRVLSIGESEHLRDTWQPRKRRCVSFKNKNQALLLARSSNCRCTSGAHLTTKQNSFEHTKIQVFSAALTDKKSFTVRYSKHAALGICCQKAICKNLEHPWSGHCSSSMPEQSCSTSACWQYGKPPRSFFDIS